MGKLCNAWFEGREFGVVDLRFISHFKIMRTVGTLEYSPLSVLQREGHLNISSSELPIK
jgi:hypothetical protein